VIVVAGKKILWQITIGNGRIILPEDLILKGDFFRMLLEDPNFRASNSEINVPESNFSKIEFFNQLDLKFNKKCEQHTVPILDFILFLDFFGFREYYEQEIVNLQKFLVKNTANVIRNTLNIPNDLNSKQKAIVNNLF